MSEAEALFARMLDGEMSDDELRDTLVTMADRGETAPRLRTWKGSCARFRFDRRLNAANLQEIGEQGVAMLCGDAFGMELDTVNG